MRVHVIGIRRLLKSAFLTEFLVSSWLVLCTIGQSCPANLRETLRMGRFGAGNVDP